MSASPPKADIVGWTSSCPLCAKSGHSVLGLFRCSDSGGFASHRLVVASGRADRAALVEYRRLLTRSSHLSSAPKPFAILNARKAICDLVPQTPSAGPARNPSSMSRFCAAIISPGGELNLLAPCSGVTAAVGSAWRDELATACGFAASVLFPWKKPAALQSKGLQ